MLLVEEHNPCVVSPKGFDLLSASNHQLGGNQDTPGPVNRQSEKPFRWTLLRPEAEVQPWISNQEKQGMGVENGMERPESCIKNRN